MAEKLKIQIEAAEVETGEGGRSPVLALLTRGRDLVMAGWTSQVYARDASGRAVEPRAAAARRFCAVGALIRADWELNGEPFERVELPIIYEGSETFVTALAILSAAAQIVVVVPRERSKRRTDRVWAKAALRSVSRGLIDTVNDRGANGKQGIVRSYELAIQFAGVLPSKPSARAATK